MTPFDSQVNVQDLPDGTVSISNPDVEPMPMPAPKPAPSPSIAVGEPHKNTPEPRLAGPDSAEGQASSSSTGTAVTDFGVNGSDPVPAPEPEEEDVAPNPTIESDVPLSNQCDPSRAGKSDDRSDHSYAAHQISDCLQPPSYLRLSSSEGEEQEYRARGDQESRVHDPRLRWDCCPPLGLSTRLRLALTITTRART